LWSDLIYKWSPVLVFNNISASKTGIFYFLFFSILWGWKFDNRWKILNKWLNTIFSWNCIEKSETFLSFSKNKCGNNAKKRAKNRKKKKTQSKNLERTLSVKFEIYLCQMIIFRGILNNCPIYFLSSYYYISFLYIHIKVILY
jgi:hypothetical protein